MTLTTNGRDSIVIVGAGYVGLINAVVFASHGHRVWCVDIDEDKVSDLERGHAPMSEPGFEEALNTHGSALHFGVSLPEALAASDAKFVFITVGTPADSDGAPHLDDVHRAVEQVPDESEVAIVMKSTVPPGTGRALLAKAEREGKRLRYVSCPEFLREGQAMKDFRNPDRVVVGGEEGSWEREGVCNLHVPLVGESKIFRTDVASAETIKQGSNAFLAVKTSLINEIANICEETGADIADVARGIGLDKRIGEACLKAGVGFGGSCFTKDVMALSWTARANGCRLTIGDALLQVNEEQADRVLRKLQQHLGTLAGRTIALLGLSFKPDTDDLRNGRAFAIASRLRHHEAFVRAYDPDPRACKRALTNAEHRVARTEWLTREELAESALDALRGADACVLVTEWDEFTRIDWSAARREMAGDLVIDGRNALDPADIRDAGFIYEGTGRFSAGLPVSPPTPDSAP